MPKTIFKVFDVLFSVNIIWWIGNHLLVSWYATYSVADVLALSTVRVYVSSYSFGCSYLWSIWLLMLKYSFGEHVPLKKARIFKLQCIIVVYIDWVMSLGFKRWSCNFKAVTCSNHVQDGDSMSSWCGWHTDHGSLTGDQFLFSPKLSFLIAGTFVYSQLIHIFYLSNHYV